MSLIPEVGRKRPSARAFTSFVYAALIVLGATMVVPFLITLTSSTTNNFDYQRFWPIPRYFWSTNDRYMKGLVYFFNSYRGCNAQMRAYIPDMPSYWTSWSTIGRDINNVDAIARKCMARMDKDPDRERLIAADYSHFCDQLPLLETCVTVINPQAVNFMQEFYLKLLKEKAPDVANSFWRRTRTEGALKLLSENWGLPYESFYNVNFSYELNSPMDFQTWYPPIDNPKYKDFIRLKNAYRAQIFTPGVKGDWLSFLREKKYDYKNSNDVFPVTEFCDKKLHGLWNAFKAKSAPAAPTVPYALRAAWHKFLRSEEVSTKLKLKTGERFTIKTYNEIAKTNYQNLESTPFPVPKSFPKKINDLWRVYVETRFPLRLTTIEVTEKLQNAYTQFLQKEIKILRVANELLGRENTSWDQFKLSSSAPEGAQSEIIKNRRNVWGNFVKRLPLSERELTCSEIRYHKFLLDKYGSLEKINAAYGWDLGFIEEAFPPFMTAYTITFLNNQMAFTFTPILYNYKVIFEYLILNANAVQVTFWLVALTILCTLTINPLAAYSLSRFNLKGQDKIILFMLSTMAFPAMVSAIPAYLLMRDLGLLNTFFALVLPGAANGMSIFILKGFFDSLPQELFEAATIDGANELQIFRIVAMPLVKPILAINCLTAFIVAYNGWQWALIICQEKSMWTIAVWMYQASRWWASAPWLVSAGFIVASIPTFLVFVFSQKIILKGIVIPSMK